VHIPSVEELKKPSGLWQIAQAILTAGLLGMGSWISYNAHRYTEAAEEQGKSLIRLEIQMEEIQHQVLLLESLPQSLTRIETKMDEAERRIHEIEQTKALR
jgi:hypothetical protein